MAHNNPASAQNTTTSTTTGFPALDTSSPIYGVLTRTLIHSPVVKQIVPARIRGKELNDVVFIGETFIELYLLSEDGRLRKVATKSDFQADIRHARVVSCDQNFVYTDAESSKPEGLFQNEQMPGDTKKLLPPHILALTLDSGHLAFLYAVNKPLDENKVEFILSTRKIDSKGVHPRHLGKSLAVDPRSRCLAITAYQDSFRMYALHPAEQLECQLQEGIPLSPIKEEKTFNVNGVILNMEFLHPPPSDPDHVIIILFIVDQKQKFRLLLYEWWSSKPLQTATKYGQHGLRLPDEVSMPLHIIPLLIGTAFLIITEHCIHAVRWNDITSGNAYLPRIEFPKTLSDSGKPSLVTSWARPLRTPSHTTTMDDLYLALEDGDIFFVEVDTSMPNLVQLVNKAGHLNCSIGSAFAALDYGLDRNDLLVAGGEMSSGGVYLLKIGPSSPPTNPPNDEEPKLEETVANWSPVFDFDLINPLAQGQADGRAVRDRLYACTGRGEHGAIAEIRYGIEASIQSSADYLQGIRSIWVLPDASAKGFFLLCALPGSSSLCFLTATGEWEDVSECSFFDTSQPTLVAGAFGERSLQITPKAINVTLLREDQLSVRRNFPRDIPMVDQDQATTLRWTRQCAPEDLIVGGALYGDYIVVAVRTGYSVRMTLATLLPILDATGNFLDQLGTHVELQEDPSFISILEIERDLIAAVGTRNATIQFFLFDLSNGLVPLLEQSMAPAIFEDAPVQRDLFICESTSLVKSPSTTHLLCGLRDGTLVIFNVRWSFGILMLERQDEVRFGPIPVQVLPNHHQRNSVFVLAGPELYRFEVKISDIKASQIVFDGSVVEPTLGAVCQIDNSPNTEGFIVCVTRNQIFYAEIGQAEKVCVRRLEVSETPRRVLYYKPLNHLIVACSKSVSETSPATSSDSRSAKKKGSFCSLSFLDPRTGESKGDKEIRDTSKGDLIFGKPNEQIYGLVEWHVEMENRVYHYIAIGTGFINTTTAAKYKGRVIIISVQANAAGRVEIRRRLQISCDSPVYSISPYGKSSLAFCSGNCLMVKNLNGQTKKLDPVAEQKLRSPAVQITVNEPFINASCAADSLCIFKLEGDQLIPHFSDKIARNGFSHFAPKDDFFLLSDKQYGVAGLWQPPERRTNGSMTTVFEAELTSSISRIRKGKLRPPWNLNKPRPGILFPDEDIIGTGVDGSIFHLTILEENALKLLRYIQNLYTMKTEVHRHHRQNPAHLTDSENSDPFLRHVDGNILKAVLDLGETWLHEAVSGREADLLHRTGPSFSELVQAILGGDGGIHSISMAMVYLRNLLEGVVL